MRVRVVAADALSTQRQHLWELSYRITGSTSDADAVVRECADSLGEARAAELAVDALKRRRLRSYAGRWLPAAVETGTAASTTVRPPGGRGPRYDLVESGTIAFLRALEGLDPRERAVFVMVDTCGLHVHDVVREHARRYVAGFAGFSKPSRNSPQPPKAGPPPRMPGTRPRR